MTARHVGGRQRFSREFRVHYESNEAATLQCAEWRLTQQKDGADTGGF